MKKNLVMKIKNASLQTFYLKVVFRRMFFDVTGTLRCHRCLVLKVIACMLMLFSLNSTFAQGKSQLVRLSKLVIDSTQLESYKAALKEEIETSVRLEPGVRDIRIAEILMNTMKSEGLCANQN